MKFGNMELAGKDLPKAILYLVGLSAIVCFNFSWIQAVTFSLLIFSIAIWILAQKFHRRTCQRVFKYIIVTILIFAISFLTVENYAFWNAGYPSTFNSSQPNVTVAYPNILNASIVEIIQGIKNTHAFSVLSLEYPGENTLLVVKLHTQSYTKSDGGEILIRYNHASKFDFSFNSHDGKPYDVRAIPWSRTLPAYIQPQTVDKSLQQIDDLGLQWFYDRTIEECQKKSEDGLSQIGTNTEITDLRVTIMWDDFEDYQGLTLQMSCFFKDPLSKSVSFTSVFQPDGTLL